jgi:hypothetical protein
MAIPYWRDYQQLYAKRLTKQRREELIYRLINLAKTMKNFNRDSGGMACQNGRVRLDQTSLVPVLACSALDEMI